MRTVRRILYKVVFEPDFDTVRHVAIQHDQGVMDMEWSDDEVEGTIISPIWDVVSNNAIQVPFSHQCNWNIVHKGTTWQDLLSCLQLVSNSLYDV